MGLFTRKLPASQGLLKVAAANVLMTLDHVEETEDAVAIAALLARHVAEAAEGVGALPNAMNDFEEQVWATVCETRPALASRRLMFCLFYLKAHSLVRQANDKSIARAYFDDIAVQRGGGWALSVEEYLAFTSVALDAAIRMIVDHRHEWKREIA